ncbi:GNAT family N-acetyltransferase [Clostridium botulinum]|uniref:GNAT family N-acetyltransferase n=1 Tax=Clostridium botulinum TaxID=1491 RepID=UPI003DA61898
MYISWLYLLHTERGTGTKILKWFIDYCERNNIKEIRIQNIEKQNKAMRKLCEKFGFEEIEENENFSNYILHLV